MAHKRVRSNRARRIVNFRRFDVASVSAFRGGGEGGRAGLSQRSRARNSAGSFVQVGWERARQWIHTCTISTKLENIYEASRKMNEKSVAKALWSSVLCSSGTRQTFLQRDVVSSRFWWSTSPSGNRIGSYEPSVSISRFSFTFAHDREKCYPSYLIFARRFDHSRGSS